MFVIITLLYVCWGGEGGLAIDAQMFKQTQSGDDAGAADAANAAVDLSSLAAERGVEGVFCIDR